jgi:hypothetical protein
MLLMLIASIPLLANGLWRNFLLLSWRGSDRTGKRSHGLKRIQHPNIKKASKPRTLQDTFNDLLSNIQKPLGIHHIRTILFSLPVNYIKDLSHIILDYLYLGVKRIYASFVKSKIPKIFDVVYR